MRIATLRRNGGTIAAVVGGEDGNTLRIHPVPRVADVGELLRAPDRRELLDAAAGTATVRVPRTDLAPVIPHPGKIICVGLNYTRHIVEMGHDLPGVPTLFTKFEDALCGPYDEVRLRPGQDRSADYEGELAVVVGAVLDDVDEERAARGIAGWAIMNDFTNRDMQYRTLQWHQGKSLLRSSGFGPWLTTAGDWRPGPRLTTRVNDEPRQDAPTDDLVFPPARLLSFISSLYPLRPGDVIATGTPAGVGHGVNPPCHLRDGDVVEISIDGLGTIRNRVRMPG